jgi:uroporphyrinogen-III synthase
VRRWRRGRTGSWPRSVADRPLAGRRIVVTRPEAQARLLADALAGLGADVAVVPLVEIRTVALPTDLDASAYDWIVLTSANGVAACSALLAHPDCARVAVVGPATAAAARALGVEPAFVPERFAADAIADGLGEVEGARVLIAQADLADPALADELRARGANVDAVVAYRTVPRAPSEEETRALGRADIVVVASGSAARALAATRAVTAHAIVACIGPKTAAVAAEVGLTVGLVADEATANGMIRALVTQFGEST